MALDLFWSVHHQIRNQIVIPPGIVERKCPYTVLEYIVVETWQSITDFD